MKETSMRSEESREVLIRTCLSEGEKERERESSLVSKVLVKEVHLWHS